MIKNMSTLLPRQSADSLSEKVMGRNLGRKIKTERNPIKRIGSDKNPKARAYKGNRAVFKSYLQNNQVQLLTLSNVMTPLHWLKFMAWRPPFLQNN